MKIIHILLGKANPERMNGVNKIVHELAMEMVRQKLDVEVWGLTTTPNDKTFKRDYPLHLFEVNGRSFAFNPLVAEAIEALPDNTCVHFHGVMTPAFYKIAQALRKRKLPWVLTPHGAYMPQSMQRNYLLKALYIKVFDQFLLKNAQMVHVNTANEQKAVHIWCKNAPIVIIPNAHSLQAVSKNTDFCPLYHRTRPVFGYMGRLDQIHKGLDLLIEGFAKYVDEKGKGELWLVGDGPHRRLLHRQVKKLNLDHRVRFWGPRFGDEKANVIQNMDIFLHTSRWEGMPMAVLEAGACGKPLLVSHGTGLADTVRQWEAGFTLENNTSDTIADALMACEQAYRDLTLGSKSHNARKMIESEFNWPTILNRMNNDVYKVAA